MVPANDNTMTDYRTVEGESQCRAIFENSLDALLFVNSKNRNQIISANPSACNMFNAASEKLSTVSLDSLLNKADAQTQLMLRELDEKGSSKGTVSFVREDQTRFSAEVSLNTFLVCKEQPRTLVIIRDLSEAIEKENVLREYSAELEKLNRRLLLATKSANMGIWEWDASSERLTWDEGMHEIFAVDQNRRHFSLEEWSGLVVEEDRQRALHEMMNALTSGQYESEYKIQAGHSIRHIRATGIVEKNAEGKAIRIIGMKWDVTKEKKAEERVRNSENVLRNIDANSADMICSVNEKSQFIHVSAACKRILGYNPDEMIGKALIDFVHPDDKERTLLTAQYIMAGNPIQNFENRYIHKDGSPIPLIWAVRWDKADRIRYGVARDAREIKKAEKIIASERRRLKDLVTNAPVSMCILKGKDHVFDMVNAAYEELSGRTNIIGKTVREVFPEVESQGFYKLLDTVFETGVPFIHNEHPLRLDVKGDGVLKEIYLNFIYQPYRNSDGEVEGIYYFGVDVTEQVESRKKIEQADQRYRQIVETAEEGIWVIDKDDVTTFVNDKLCGLLEYTREEMLGRQLDHFLHKESKVEVSEGMERRRKGKSGRSHVKYITKNGKELWANVSANPLFDSDGNYNGALAMITDITAQRQTEEENEKLGFVASLTVNSVMITDAKGRITWVNKGFERATEYAHQEVLGKFPTDFLQGIATDPRTIRYIQGCYKNEIGFRVEVLQYSKSNRPHWMDVEAVPLRDRYGKLNGFIAIQHDITERKESEKEKLSLIDNLQKRNQELQQFSYIVSHNLRAPIAKILGLASIIKPNDEENRVLLDVVAEEANQLDDIIKDINTIVSARKSPSDKMEFVELKTMASQVLQSFEDEIASMGISVRAEFPTVEKVFYIKSYLYSILYNLISNAIKYRRQYVPLEIEIKACPDDKFICLQIQDNGSGIDLKKNGSKIFGLYKRFHEDKIAGKGVGLHLVKTHAEALGGRVEVESQINHGTIFKIFLPNNYGTESVG